MLHSPLRCRVFTLSAEAASRLLPCWTRRSYDVLWLPKSLMAPDGWYTSYRQTSYSTRGRVSKTWTHMRGAPLNRVFGVTDVNYSLICHVLPYGTFDASSGVK